MMVKHTRAVKAICLKGTDAQQVVEQVQQRSTSVTPSVVSRVPPVHTEPRNMVNQASGVKAARVQKRIRRNRRLSQIQQPHSQITVQESNNVPKPSPTKPRVLLYVF